MPDPVYVCTIGDPQKVDKFEACAQKCCFSCEDLNVCRDVCEDITNGNTDKPETCCFAEVRT